MSTGLDEGKEWYSHVTGNYESGAALQIAEGTEVYDLSEGNYKGKTLVRREKTN